MLNHGKRIFIEENEITLANDLPRNRCWKWSAQKEIRRKKWSKKWERKENDKRGSTTTHSVFKYNMLVYSAHSYGTMHIKQAEKLC